MRRPRALRLIVAVTAVIALSGADDCSNGPTPTPTPTPPTSQFTPFRTPTQAPATPQAPTSTPTARPAPSAAPYPYNDAQAMAYVQSGITVAGLAPQGGEVTIREVQETVYEDQQVWKQVCDYEYDYATGKDEYKCKMQQVTERRPVTKTYYQVSGTAGLRSRHSNYLGAFAAATGIGVHKWRTI